MDSIAWAAGLFEGEGCFFINRAGRKLYLYPCAALKMTDRDVVERFAKVVGFGRVQFTKRGKRHWRDSWLWRCNGKELTQKVYNLFKPFLGKRRLKTGLEVLSKATVLRTRDRSHGSASQYRLGCRCRVCRNGQRDRQREWRAKRRFDGVHS